MAVKDRALADLLERAMSQEYRLELEGGAVVRFGRLTVNDLVKLDEELGINLFGEMMEAAREGGGLPKVWSYAFQRKILALSLRKFEPEITDDEAGVLLSLIPVEKLGEILTWVLTGTVGRVEQGPLATKS